MSEFQDIESLLGEFEHTNSDKWHEQIAAQLKTEDLTGLIPVLQGIKADPFVHAEEESASANAIGHSSKWEIAEIYPITDERQSNAALLEALAGGCEP